MNIKYVFLLLLVAFIFGVFSYRNCLLPYSKVSDLKETINGKKKKNYIHPSYKVGINLQNIYTTKHAKVVMLGDSLTARVNWNELIGYPIVNRGIDGDITKGYLNRLDVIVNLEPTQVFINGGTNDLAGNYSVIEIFNNYKEIIAILKEHKINIYMQSTIYTSYPKYNNDIKKLNVLLKSYCELNNIQYINLNTKLSKNDTLIEKYTLDGSHLNAKGYQIWKEEISKYISL